MIKKRPDYEEVLSCGLCHISNRYDIYNLNNEM